MKTRAEAIREFADATGPDTNSAQQAVALHEFCEALEHIGYMRGYGEATLDAFVFRGEAMGDSRAALDPVDVPR